MEFTVPEVLIDFKAIVTFFIGDVLKNRYYGMLDFCRGDARKLKLSSLF